MCKAASKRSSFTIHNSFHSIHLNTAMLLSMVFAPEKAALAGMLQTVALHTEHGNN